MGSLTRFNLPDILSRFSIDTLVVTGAFDVDMVDSALRGGFGNIHASDQYVSLITEYPQVQLWQEKRASFLSAIVATTMPRAMYFLSEDCGDGSSPNPRSVLDSNVLANQSTLLAELSALLAADLTNSVVIVNNARMYFEGAFQNGSCPESARCWEVRPVLSERLGSFETTHSVTLLHQDDGYLVIVPKSFGFDQRRWLMICGQDSSGPVSFLPNLPGVTGISIQRRLSDSRFATRYFRGNGIDIGGSPDSLAAYKELFPLIRNVFVYDQSFGDGQILDNVPNATFDFLYASHCLEHLRDPTEAVSNWIRVVKPGGHLVVSVPDEDLYEQGVWPSRFNSDHKTSFTIAKSGSWSPVSVNVLDLLGQLRNSVEIISINRIDHGYREMSLPRTIDQTRTPLAECAIEFVLKKRTRQS